MKLTDTQRAILAAAAQHPDHLALPPARLPAVARQTVAKALLKNDLMIAVHRPAYDAQALWVVDGDSVLLKITDEGLRVIGMAPQGAAPATDAAPTPHTVRGFFAGLKKRQGIAVEVLERVRQVGPNKEGARGSYTIYRVPG